MLWPQPIPILGITGEYESGKTFLGISISPDPKRLRVYDFELSADPYKTLGFDYVNVPAELSKKFPKGPRPIDVWNWWLDDVSTLEPGRFDVIHVDPITDLERGLVDWVECNPGHFGHTTGQYNSMSGVKWGDVKDYWKLILTTRVAVKCQTFSFVAHMGDEWDKGTKKPTGDRKPKGKDTLMELASLYLQMERPKDKTGNRKAVPSAIVLKTRLSHLVLTEAGPTIRPALPPRLPVATPAAIRQYLTIPMDYENLKDGEKAPERVMTDDDRLKLQVQRAEAERETALLNAGKEARKEGSGLSAPVATVVEQSPAPDLFSKILAALRAAPSKDDLGNVVGTMNEIAARGEFTADQIEQLKAAIKERKSVLSKSAEPVPAS